MSLLFFKKKCKKKKSADKGLSLGLFNFEVLKIKL
jgi:hypothetical protein